MNYLVKLTILLFLLTSCSRQKEDKTSNNQYQITIDSAFLKNYKVSGLTKLQSVENIEVADNDAIFETAKTKLEFYEFKAFQLTDSITVKIVLTAFAPDFLGDGTLKLIYLVTTDANGKQIDVLRIGKDEAVSDSFEFETSLIRNDTIWRQNHYEHVEDSAGHGVVREKSFDLLFVITADGKIVGK